MTQEELNEIVKGLRCWACDKPFPRCRLCEYYSKDGLPRMKEVAKNAADLIDQQAEEIERLTKERDEAVSDLSGHCEYCAFRNDCAKHDNNGSGAGFTWWTDCDEWEWRGRKEQGHE